MADEPVSPQERIDDAAKMLDTSSVPSPLLPTEPPRIEKQESPSSPSQPEETIQPPEEKKESVIIPPSTEIITPSQTDIPSVIPETPPPPPAESFVVPQHESVSSENTIVPPDNTPKEKSKPKTKKKSGILIAGLVLLILTLPVAIYYVTQSPQFAEIRSRATTTSVYPKTIVQYGCVGGSFVNVQKVGYSCSVCTHGGTMTCDGPSGGSGGDPCTVKYSDDTSASVSCSEANMIRCNCGGEAWVGGRPGVTCAQMCACAGIQCTQCSPTPTATTTGNPSDTPIHTSTPTGTGMITGTISPTNTATPTGTETNTPTNTNTPTPTNTSTTPIPGTCDASCGSDSECESGLSCLTVTGVKRCRRAACSDHLDCSCPSTATPTTYVTTTSSYASLVSSTTPTAQPTPKIPVAGIGPGVVGVLSVTGSILLLILGLAL